MYPKLTKYPQLVIVALLLTIIAHPLAAAGSLAGSFAATTGTPNLTALGTADWAHWGISSSISFDHKANGGGQISNFTVVNGSSGQVASFGGNPIAYTWSDGAPTVSANTATGVYISGNGFGFQLTAPADTTPRVLTVYVGAYATQGKMLAHLSDGSATDYSDTSLNATLRAYTFSYQASAAGQTLTVTFTNIGSGGNINLQAATLTAGPVVPPSPDFTISAGPANQTVTAGNSTTYTVTTAALNGFSGSINLAVTGGLPSGATASFVPPAIASSGSSVLTITTTSGTTVGATNLTITGSNASLTHNAQVALNVAPVAGSSSLTGTFTAPSGTPNLTALGTADWAHWGTSSSASFDHKATGGGQISNFTVVNGDLSQLANFGGNPIAYTWSDGAPTVSANTATGVYIGGNGFGFQLTAPADTTPRVLTVYVGAYITQGKMLAHLSDGSAPDYTDTSLNGTYRAYTFNYQASAAGQTLTVTFTNIGSGGNINLQAATLTAGPVVPPTPDFTISAGPASQTVIVGNSTTYTVTTTALNGFSGSINLAVTGGLPSGANASFVPTAITGTGSSTMTVTTTTGASTGTTNLIISGTNGALSHTTQTALTLNPVPVPDFTISALPSSKTVTVGTSASYTVTTTALNSFNSSITLAVTNGLPSGATATFVPASITGSGSSVLTITTTGVTPVTSMTINGSFGALSHNAQVSLTVNAVPVPDFNISAGPPNQTLAAGTSTTYNLSTTALNGFSGVVNLSVTSGLPTNATAAFLPTTITGSGASVLTITTTTATPTGPVTLTINGSSGALSHNAQVMLTVAPVGGLPVLTGSFVTPSGTQNLTSLGNVDWAQWGVYSSTSVERKSGGNSQISDFTVVNGEAGMVSNYSGNPIAFTWTDGAPDLNGNAATGVYVNGGTRGFQLTVPAGTSQKYFTVYIGAYATQAQVVAHLSDGSAPDFLDSTLTSGGSALRAYTFNYQAASDGQILTVTFTNVAGTGNVNLQAAYLAQKDFTISATPSSRTVTAGNSVTYTVTTTAINGFTGPISLAASSLPPGTSANFSPATITGAGGSTVTITTTGPTPGGAYSPVFTGTNASLNHSATVSLNVNGIPQPDFVISLSPGSQTVTAGTNTTYQISTTALNGFNDVVVLSASGLPTGATAQFAPSSIIGSGTSVMTVTTTAATVSNGYSLVVTGTNGALIRTGQGSLIVYPAAGSNPPGLSGSYFLPTSPINLTALGTSDWAHWGLAAANSFDHKASGGSQISNFTVSGVPADSVTQHSDYPIPMTWSDGTPTASSGPTPNGVYIRGINASFTLTVPADSTRRLLILYLGLFNAGSHLVGHMSDGSSPDFTSDWSGAGSRAYTLVYSAASAHQTLTITFTQTAILNPNNNITLEGAALSVVNPAADFVLTSAPALQSIAPGGVVTYNLAVTPQAGFGGIVGFSASGWPANTTVSFNPPAVIGAGLVLVTVQTTNLTLLGSYTSTVTAASQSSSHSPTMQLNVLGGPNPYLGGSSFTPNPTTDLTAQGTADWAYWGLYTSSSFDHKASVDPQIQNFTVVNGTAGQVATSATLLNFTWTYGTPDAADPGTNNGVVIQGLNLGFQIVAPADTNQRTLTLYGGVFNSVGKLVAHLSDGSAVDYVDTAFSDPAASIPAGYIITYKAASAGQTLTLQWTMSDNTGPRCTELSGVHCLVILNAATLSKP